MQFIQKYDYCRYYVFYDCVSCYYSSSALRDVTRLRSIINICSNQMSHVLFQLDKMWMIDIIIYFNNDFLIYIYLYQSFLCDDINLTTNKYKN